MALKNASLGSTWTEAHFLQTRDNMKNTGLKIKRLYEVIGTEPVTTNRRKRGLFNTIGMKTLFGTMDNGDAELYNLYKVLPVPTGTPGAEKNHLYTYVQPHTDYIAVSTDEQRYIPMTRCQFNDCKGKTVNMCVGPNVVNNLASGQDTSESAYFRQIKPPKELCDTRLSYVATSIWTEIPGTDRWIFVLPREEVMTFKCPGTDGLPEHEGTEYVQGTGLLTLPTKFEIPTRRSSSHQSPQAAQ
ncbi:hypothetical protein J6590_083820 [Homalodisca vitripennis]|nr:hypothetical protein J6590_083820 [Homalodisca vitripennis]